MSDKTPRYDDAPVNDSNAPRLSSGSQSKVLDTSGSDARILSLVVADEHTSLTPAQIIARALDGDQPLCLAHSPRTFAPPIPDAPAAVVAHIASIAEDIRRIADHLVPPPSAYMDSPELAQRLGCTTTWVAEMARDGRIPKSCIVVGTGNGKPWKFHRAHIEKWLAVR